METGDNSTPEQPVENEFKRGFRPRARLLQLLGDELIGTPRLAVFELVKNAYDADASSVLIRLDFREPSAATITVDDDGEGMSREVIEDVWLVPGDDFRKKQRDAGLRTSRHHRLPLGEKGLGRFAVHKLGNEITLVTRAAGRDECVVSINWNELLASSYLEEALVTVKVRKPERFSGDRTGTHISIAQLRQASWTRRDVRELQRQVTSICSPFRDSAGFRATLEVPGFEEWIADIPDVDTILQRAIWQYTFQLQDGVYEWVYEFRGVPGLKLEPRRVEKKGDTLRLPALSGDDSMEKKVVADARTTEGIGPVRGTFFVYDRDREVLARIAEQRLLETYLDDNGGIRIYRDGIRVYNYGEPGDDWLGLDLRRVNRPTRTVSRNIILGAVEVTLEHSGGLLEKTNREGFVENDACARLRRIVLGALGTLESERKLDKDRIRQIIGPADDPTTHRIQKPISELRTALDKQGLRAQFEPYVARIEYDYQQMQETLLAAGMSGLNLAVIFHEVERGVRELHAVILRGADPEEAARRARELVHLLDGFATLLRRDSRKSHSARDLILAARQFAALRLAHHRVFFDCPFLETEDHGFTAKFSFGLILGALNNLIDNALYWMRVRWSEEPETAVKSQRRLFIGVEKQLGGGPAIVVADTGPGFGDDVPENLVRPFFTRKPDGMGLGLYYANLAMELNGGTLAFPSREDIDLPATYDGAAIALVFGKEE